MSIDNNNEYSVKLQKRVKSKLSVKNSVFFVVFGCVCLLLAWLTTYIAERIFAQDYSDTRVVFLFVVSLILFVNPLYKIWVSFCLSVCFIFCLISFYYGIAFMLRYVCAKKEKTE